MERRSVLLGLAAAGGAAGLTLAGCGTAAPPARSAGSDSREAGTAGDERLVATALGAELAAVETIQRTRRRHRSLREATDVALETHRDHVRLLRGTVEDSASAPAEPSPVPGRPREALRALVEQEVALSAGHVSTAMAARSGALARVVASMAAASSQLEQVLAGAGEGST